VISINSFQISPLFELKRTAAVTATVNLEIIVALTSFIAIFGTMRFEFVVLGGFDCAFESH
jgi:hypothetical protein